MAQTVELLKCCPFPEQKDHYNVPECKSIMEGFEKKEGKDKFMASVCFKECLFKQKGMIDEAGEFNKERIIEFTKEILSKTPEFQEITNKSLDICFEKCKKF